MINLLLGHMTAVDDVSLGQVWNLGRGRGEGERWGRTSERGGGGGGRRED